MSFKLYLRTVYQMSRSAVRQAGHGHMMQDSKQD